MIIAIKYGHIKNKIIIVAVNHVIIVDLTCNSMTQNLPILHLIFSNVNVSLPKNLLLFVIRS